MKNERLTAQTIKDFGEQWTRFQNNSDYYGSAAIFDDVFGPLLHRDELRGRRVAEIGAGTGRFVNVLLDAGVEHITAIEPSAAYEVLKRNTAERADHVTYLKIRGDHIPDDLQLDYVFSIGVLHHIPEAGRVVCAAHQALKKGGVFGAWVYGREGNRPYLSVIAPLRACSRVMPHWCLMAFVWALYGPLVLYKRFCRSAPLPLHRYMTEVLGHLSGDKVRLVIYDQLRPSYAKYYRRDELVELFANAGYADIRLHHRHGYSWSVVAVKP